MDLHQKTPRTKNLQNLTYSELRKEASKYGISGKMKTQKLITAIMSKLSNADEMFSTPAMKEFNSSRKNKENKFDEDHTTPLTTPRRGTYSVETPLSIKTEDLSSVSLTVNISDLDLSNVTVSRGSERKLRPRKVSFMSPAVTPRTSNSRSLRNRPKTPIASRTPLNESISSAQHKRKSLEDSFLDSTLLAKTVKWETESEAVNSTPQPISTQESNRDAEMSGVNLSLQNVKSSVTEEIVKQHTSKKREITLSDKKVVITKEPTSLKRGATPNFRRIHQKAFDKMESIDDYQKRKLLNSAKKIDLRPNFKSKVTKAKSKIPGFDGIPFIPSVNASSSMKLNTKINKLVSVGKRKAIKENTPQSAKNIDLKPKNSTRKDTPQPKSKFDIKNKNLSKRETPQSKSKFDLKASLSRKLGYKPYKGPLKPLTESINLPASSFINAKEPVINKVVKENRLQTRSVIRGVRVNKRFELQMRNRKLD